MNKVTAFTLSGVLLFGAVACNPNDVAKTDEAAPDSVSAPVKAPEAQEVKEARKDLLRSSKNSRSNPIKLMKKNAIACAVGLA